MTKVLVDVILVKDNYIRYYNSISWVYFYRIYRLHTVFLSEIEK